jgi:hypothetical protein
MTANVEALQAAFGTSPFADFPPATEQEPSARAEDERSESRSEKRWGWGPGALIEERGEHSNGGIDRRRSDRLAVAVPVHLQTVESVNGLEGAELVNIVELSLGGATLETASRPPLFVPLRLSLGFGEIATELTILPYHCWLHQLFYAPSRSSTVLYRVRVTFQDPSVPALNLIYRILLAHWNGEG